MRRRSMVALALGVAFVASGCRSGDGAPVAGEVSGSGVTTGDEEGPGPLSSLLGVDLDQDEMDEEFRAWQRAVDDLTVACMAAEGFTYHPPSRAEPGGPRWDLPPDEFAAEHGLGISTVGAEDGPDALDPNEQLLAGMTDGERDAWDLALHGATRDADGILDYGSQDAGTSGCLGSSADEVSVEDAFDQRAWKPLIDGINGMYDDVRRDPRVVAAAEEWRVCLSDAGHPGYSLDGQDGPTVEEAVHERLEAVAPRGGSGDDDAPAPDAGGAGSTAGAAGAAGSAPAGPDLSQLDPDELAAVQTFEIELAVAEAACREPYRAVEQEVTREHEQAFVDANRAELEAYRDAMAESAGQR